MPLVAVEIPKIGLVMDTVRVTRWLKSVGETVALGEPLLEVETEKSLVEIEAAVSGRLDQILVPVGQDTKVGQQVAWVDAADVPAAAARPTAVPARQAAPAGTIAARREAASGGRIRSTPAARRLVEERGLDLRQIAGSGPGGRVQLADVPPRGDESGANAPRSARRNPADGADAPDAAGAGARHEFKQCQRPAIYRGALNGLLRSAGGATGAWRGSGRRCTGTVGQ